MTPAAAVKKPFNFIDRLREIDMFFQGTDRVHDTMRRIAKVLDTAGIAYAIVGGMAVNAHGHERTTGDVDFLVTAEGFAVFRQLLESENIARVPGRSRRFLDGANGITFDLLITGMFPGNGKPGPVTFPDPSNVRETINHLPVVHLPTLIQLKLAAQRHQDFADVVNLIGVHRLDEAFARQLDPSVRGDYIECLEEKRREDEYEARQDEQFEERTKGSETAADLE